MTQQQLTEQAADVESEIGVHGVSVLLKRPAIGPHGQAEFENALMKFQIVHTTKYRSHWIVVLPKNITPEVTKNFNDLFKWFD